jgi:integrase
MQNVIAHDTSTGDSPKLPTDGSSTSRKQKHRHSHHFTGWDREDQLKAFLAWLPTELHNAPGIDWMKIPASAMGYCVHTVGRSPDAAYVAVAIASAHGGVTNRSLLGLAGNLNILLRFLRNECQMEQLSDLRKAEIWQTCVAKMKQTGHSIKQLRGYHALATGHIPGYLQRLDEADRTRMQAYVLPPPPHDLLKKQFPSNSVKTVQQAKRKAQSDILVPLYPVLRQLIRFRKELANRTFLAIREARRKVEAGEAKLPFYFHHSDAIPEITRDARAVSEVQIVGRAVDMHFVLWDKQTWVLHHEDRCSPFTFEAASEGRDSYAPEKNCYFVQFEGKASDLLWFGNLIEHRLLQNFKRDLVEHPKGYLERWQLARSLGFYSGCDCDRPGVLNTGDRWFSEEVHRDGDCVFEPEALYRAVLFGSALAMISLSNGSRVSELLQVSWNKERRITRMETVIALGADGAPLLGEDGKPKTRQVPIYLQHLLPKGAKTEEERQLFPLSKEAMRLLGEIKRLLEETYGEIPTVHPPKSSAKYEHLKPEQYLFQWAATPDGRQGIFSIGDVQVLLRFILHGLDVYTAQGEPIRVSVHVLRHVMATHARQYRHVPPEAIAHFFLHHRLRALTGHDPSLSDLYEYYTEKTEQQRFAIIRTDLDEQEEMDRALMRSMPSPRDLEQKNEDLRAAYAVWHALHPTALGNCGCPGLCPRGNDRSLCLGCSYHVEDPEKLGAALAWRTSYAKQAEIFEAQGNFIDARQARIKVQQLDDMINVMRMQIQKEAEGSYIPIFKVLPSPRSNERSEP